MARQAALIRGINVGRNKRIAMADLRRAVEGLGYEDVATLLQSGNLVYTTSARPATAARAIEGALADDLGVEARVLVRTRDELAAVVDGDPLADVATDPSRYMVLFLEQEPAADRLAAVEAAAYEPERFVARGREIYAWHPDGLQNARLTYAFWEKALGVAATGRNWNTVVKLLALADSE